MQNTCLVAYMALLSVVVCGGSTLIARIGTWSGDKDERRCRGEARPVWNWMANTSFNSVSTSDRGSRSLNVLPNPITSEISTSSSCTRKTAQTMRTLSSADWSCSPRWISPQSINTEYWLTAGRCILQNAEMQNAEFRIRVICRISDAELTAGLDNDVRVWLRHVCTQHCALRATSTTSLCFHLFANCLTFWQPLLHSSMDQGGQENKTSQWTEMSGPITFPISIRNCISQWHLVANRNCSKEGSKQCLLMTLHTQQISTYRLYFDEFIQLITNYVFLNITSVTTKSRI